MTALDTLRRGLDVGPRPLLWGFGWGLATYYVLTALGWPFWTAVYPISLCVYPVAFVMTLHRSIRWRVAVIRHWAKLQRPMVYNEDGAVLGGMLPFEVVHVRVDRDGPIEGHVHSRTLVLGRPRLRSVTVWRQE